MTDGHIPCRTLTLSLFKMAAIAELLEILTFSDVWADIVAAATEGDIPLATHLIQGVVIGAPAALISQVIGFFTETKHESSSPETSKEDITPEKQPGEKNDTPDFVPNKRQRVKSPEPPDENPT